MRGLSRLSAEEIERIGGAAVASHDSVDSPEGGEAIVRAATEAFGRLDIVVSNAGIFNSIAFDELAPADWRRMLSVHLDGGFHLSQPAFRVMKAQGYGRFVFITSSAGSSVSPRRHYALPDRLARIDERDRDRRRAVRIANTMLPFGFSRMVTETVPDPEYLETSQFLNSIKPELVVPLVVFLASKACGVTHHNYSACSGRFARVFVGLSNAHAIALDEKTGNQIWDSYAGIDDCRRQRHCVPTSIFDEVLGICERLSITP